MAPEKAFESEENPSGDAVFFDRQEHVIRTSRIISAMRPQERRHRFFVKAKDGQGKTLHRAGFSPESAARKSAYWLRMTGQDASTKSARVMKSISMGVLIKSLFRRKSSLARRRARFLRTAFPTFRLETADIRGYPRTLGRKTIVKYRLR
jgi:hypothetical protein